MRSRLPALALVAALGVFLIALGYAAGRRNLGWGGLAYWSGEVLLYAPVLSWLILDRNLRKRDAAGAPILLGVGTYLVKVCYSPTQLRFPDELEHWRSAQTILESHHLFGANPALPISPFYPGLENVTTAFVNLTGLSVTVSGLAVTGLCHLLATVGVYLLVEAVLGGTSTLHAASTVGEPGDADRVAALAAALYATAPHFQFFDAMFIYEAPALAFSILTLVGAVRFSAARTPLTTALWGLLATSGAAVVIVTHHVTSWALTGFLFAGVLGALLTRRKDAAVRLSLLTLVVAGGVGAWIGFVAPKTLSYLAAPARAIVDGLGSLFHGSLAPGAASGNGAASDRVAAYGVAFVTLAGLLLAWRRIGVARRGEPWVAAMSLSAGVYLLVLAIRLAASDGTELAGRALSYALVPVSFMLAFGYLTARSRSSPSGGGVHSGWRWEGIGLAGAAVLFLGGLTGGWPPSWERLPRPYLAAAFESSVSPQGIAVARWADAQLGRNNRFGVDSGNYALISSIGWQVPVRNAAPLYYGSAWTPGDASLAAVLGVHYLLVDQRLSRRVPVTDYYFPVDPHAGQLKTPISRRALAKFNDGAGINRLYDNGAIVVYDLAGTR